MSEEQKVQTMKALHNFCEYLSIKGIPQQEIAEALTAASLAILVDEYGNEGAINFYLHLAADVQQHPREENAK